MGLEHEPSLDDGDGSCCLLVSYLTLASHLTLLSLFPHLEMEPASPDLEDWNWHDAG